ncbi:hypothetical protein XA68_13685 [Ophiocordyceps unilateralis]|uniref:MT-A70 family n=1 Tax=Ophiocordyceps unilateralis TaxID=268505 RepID=A0A2A9PC20_OPHUN|nr:hypothetical protein XA68_13685 [Ophiocordyceps unilateralis]
MKPTFAEPLPTVASGSSLVYPPTLCAGLPRGPSWNLTTTDFDHSFPQRRRLPVRRLRSDPPPPAPLPTPEPHGALPSVSAAVLVADLMTAAAAQRALLLLAAEYAGPFHLERSSSAASSVDSGPDSDDLIVPAGAEYVCGPLEETKEALLHTAPPFDLIVLDPPWPNRSVRRRQRHQDRYATPRTLSAVRQLLLQVPVAARLAPDGLVAVWVTNKPAAYCLLTSPTGVFAAWGLELAAEWTWLKIAASGEPLYDLDSTWRKPWERLLIAKPRRGCVPRSLTAKVIVAAPDVHSRKPSLRTLFREVLERDYIGLEVFARNLTAGWWSWGDEVVKFQQPHCWLPVSQRD